MVGWSSLGLGMVRWLSLGWMVLAWLVISWLGGFGMVGHLMVGWFWHAQQVEQLQTSVVTGCSSGKCFSSICRIPDSTAVHRLRDRRLFYFPSGMCGTSHHNPRLPSVQFLQVIRWSAELSSGLFSASFDFFLVLPLKVRSNFFPSVSSVLLIVELTKISLQWCSVSSLTP